MKHSQINLYWLTREGQPFRSVILSKTAVYGAFTIFALFAASTLALAIWLTVSANSIARMKTENSELKETLAKQSLQIEELRSREDSLTKKQSELLKEVEVIREMEGKIRRFLGLNESAGSEELSHQGGSGQLSVTATPDQLLELPGEEAHSHSPTREVIEKLNESVDFLENRHKDARTVPTILPVKADELWVPSRFGWRKNPVTGEGREFHNGLDVASSWKTPIIAPADGLVKKTGNDRYLGRYVRLKHGSGIETIYGHLATIKVKQGQKVTRGDTVGLMGNSGRSTGTHLHYSILKDGYYVDPINFIWDRIGNTLAVKK